MSQRRVSLQGPVRSSIPEYLTQFIVDQDPNLYTAIDHACWRYIIKVSKDFFKKHAHPKYVGGLVETGINEERIPLISEMDAALSRLGWRAVGVSGFIPPAVFMELQAMGVLPIAADIRMLEHISYTPAPDIVHEAAGHAPILADKEYSAYLRNYGEVARKAIFSSQDMEVYEAIRNLSEVKEDPQSTASEIADAQTRLEKATANQPYVSEAAYLARMNWWTAEYGLVGELNDPLIYGAGLLSSIGESYHCLKSDVTKIPISLDCLNMGYDITRPQPQLYVTPSFPFLSKLLEETSKTMAFKQGGVSALAKARTAGTVTTTQLDSGIEIGGILKNFFSDTQGVPSYLQYEGPCQLAYEGVELKGHSSETHSQGFGTAIGALDGVSKPITELSEKDLEGLGFKKGQKGTLKFASGVTVEGRLIQRLERNGKNILLSFEECRVRLRESKGDHLLFEPYWGTYDMACGKEVVSVYGGAPDREAYMRTTGGFTQKPRVQKSNRLQQNPELIELYQSVRDQRTKPDPKFSAERIISTLETKFPNDWLLAFELIELDKKSPLEPSVVKRLTDRLRTLVAADTEKATLIRRGLKAIGQEGLV